MDKQEELELEEFDDDIRTVEPSYIETEDVQENILRPKYLSDFQGQNELKENLKIYIDAAKKRGEALDHIFLQGPPGLGKTTLASIIANEMGADIKLTSATALDKPKDLVGILTNLSKGSILFIDEIHGLKKSMEETLYVAMEDYKIDWVIGQGPAARTMKIDLEPFTLIGATTRTGAVSKPLENRFGIPVKIDLYSPEELSLIIRRSARILNTDITDDAVMAIARCSRGTPRIANRILRRVRDIAQVKGNGTITREMAGIGLEKLGIDKYGLDKTDREILRVIIEIYNGGPVGLEALAASINDSADTVEVYYEPYLMRQGYLKRTTRGRCVTQKAYEVLGKKDIYADQGFLL
ncbi:MAG: Holliday junction branch migration DNA helicase RuvB [Candidatus Ornithospirochaeta sp.]